MSIPTPVSFWNLNESSGNASDAVASNTLTNNNTTTYVAGLISNAAEFVRASSQSLSITDAAQTGLDPGGAMSMQAWIRITALPSSGDYHTVAAKGGISITTTDSTCQYLLFIANDGAQTVQAFARGAGNNMAASHAVSLSTGVWNHLVLTYEPSVALRLWINGTNVASDTSSISGSLVNTARPFAIGADQATGAANFFNGRVDMVGVWNVLLTSAEISSLYNAGAGIQFPFASASNSNFFAFM